MNARQKAKHYKRKYEILLKVLVPKERSILNPDIPDEYIKYILAEKFLPAIIQPVNARQKAKYYKRKYDQVIKLAKLIDMSLMQLSIIELHWWIVGKCEENV